MPEEVLIVFIVFGSIVLTIRTFVSYFKWKNENKGAGKEGSLRTSELKALIREAVEEANVPLHRRIDELEEMLDEQQRPRLMPAEREDPLLASLTEEDEDHEGAPETVRARQRSA